MNSYQTVALNCNSARIVSSGTKSDSIKCYVERIVRGDPDDGVLEQQLDIFAELSEMDHKWTCPNCGMHFGSHVKAKLVWGVG